MKTKNNNLSPWLPQPEYCPRASNLNDLNKTLSWLEVGSGNPVIEKLPISPKIGTSSNFHETIFRVFGGEPKRVVPPIQNQKNSQSMLDFLGRGFAIQGPAINSQPLTSDHQKPSVNQKSLLDFMTNPFASPSPIIVAPRINHSNDHKPTIIYC